MQSTFIGNWEEPFLSPQSKEHIPANRFYDMNFFFPAKEVKKKRRKKKVVIFTPIRTHIIQTDSLPLAHSFTVTHTHRTKNRP